MSYTGALSTLTALAITGITNYAYNAQPAALPASALPAMVLTLADTVEYGLRSLTLQHTAARAVVVVDHTLLIRPVARNSAARATLASAAATHIDNYLIAVAGDMTMSSNLMEPLVIFEIIPAPVEYAGVAYDACVFRHIWALEL